MARRGLVEPPKGVGCGRGTGSFWSCFGSARRPECLALPRFDVGVDYCIIEIVTRAHFVGLLLETDRDALRKRNHNSL
jgi:hypothetical protein